MLPDPPFESDVERSHYQALERQIRESPRGSAQRRVGIEELRRLRKAIEDRERERTFNR